MWRLCGGLAVRSSGYPLIDARGKGRGSCLYSWRGGEGWRGLAMPLRHSCLADVFRGKVYREMVVGGFTRIVGRVACRIARSS